MEKETMETKNTQSIWARLAKARALLNAKVREKSGVAYNNMTYFELADILPHINNVCNDLELCPIIRFEEECEGKNKMAYMDIFDGATSSPTFKDVITINFPITEVSLTKAQKIQENGAMQTYAIRYLYMNAFAISESDILDVGTSGLSDEQKSLIKLLQNNGVSIADVAKAYGTPITDLTSAQLRSAIKRKWGDKAEEMLKNIPHTAEDESDFRSKIQTALKNSKQEEATN